MIDCDFCGAVTRVVDNRCLACGLPVLGDWPDAFDGVRRMCATSQNHLTQDKTGAKISD